MKITFLQLVVTEVPEHSKTLPVRAVISKPIPLPLKLLEGRITARKLMLLSSIPYQKEHPGRPCARALVVSYWD